MSTKGTRKGGRGESRPAQPRVHFPGGRCRRREESGAQESPGRHRRWTSVTELHFCANHFSWGGGGVFVCFICTTLHPDYFFSSTAFISYFNLWKCVFCATLSPRAPDPQADRLPLPVDTREGRSRFRHAGTPWWIRRSTGDMELGCVNRTQTNKRALPPQLGKLQPYCSVGRTGH